MQATTLLKQQHQEVNKLFDRFKETTDVEQRRKAFLEVADLLSGHAEIEESLFYPAVYVGDMESQLQEAVAEHFEVKKLIGELLDLDPSSPEFEAKVVQLEESVLHHVEEEENDLFPKVQASFTGQELNELGREMDAMMEEIRRGERRIEPPGEATQPAPLE